MESRVGELCSIRKRERTIVRKRRETNRERVCCCSLPWLGSVDASSGGWKLLGKPWMEGGLRKGGEGGGEDGRELKNRGKTVLEKEKKGLIRVVGTALLKDQLTEKGFLGRKVMQGRAGLGVEQVLCSRERRVTSKKVVYLTYKPPQLVSIVAKS